MGERYRKGLGGGTETEEGEGLVVDESFQGKMNVAALRVRFDPIGSRRSSERKDRKLGVSFDEMVLHPIPCLLGYSQSKSRPSRLYWVTRFVRVLMNDERFWGEPTLVEYHREPVQPPIEREAFTPC